MGVLNMNNTSRSVNRTEIKCQKISYTRAKPKKISHAIHSIPKPSNYNDIGPPLIPYVRWFSGNVQEKTSGWHERRAERPWMSSAQLCRHFFNP